MNPPPSPPPRVPDYELFRCIGRGGYGEVWLAKGVTGIWRAVKIVRRDRFADDRPFLRELEGITRFQKTQFAHGTQLALLHVGRNDSEGTFHYVMELADDAESGSEISPDHYVALTLKEYRVRRGQVPIADCLRIGVDLARALAGLHGQHLVHRDIKPSNIIFVSGTPKLCDIGLVSSSEQTLTSVGTPGYCPPEGPGSASADIYGLGKVLYELATGMNPRDFPMMPPGFVNRSDAMALLELNEVILKACDPVPSQRHPNAQALLDELLLLQAGGSIRELKAARLRIHQLFRVLRWAGAFSIVTIALLGVINGIHLRRIADQERAAAAQQETEARHSRYVTALQQAASFIARGSFAQTRLLLDQQLAPSNQTPRIPGLELQILRGEASERSLRVLRHPARQPVKHVSLNAAGDRLAAAFQDGQGLVWALLSTNPPTVLPDAFSTRGFLSTGTDLVLGTAQREIRTQSILTGLLSPPESVRERILQLLPDRRRALLISPTYPNRFQLHDLEAHKVVASVDLTGEWANNELTAVTCSPDGHWLAIGVAVDSSARRERHLSLWDWTTGRMQWSRTMPGRVECLQFSRDDQELAVGTARTRLWLVRPNDGALLHELVGHSEQILDLAYSPDQRWLASTGADATIQLWNRTNLAIPQRLLSHGSTIQSLSFNDAGTLLASGSDDGEIRLWSIPPPPSPNTLSGLWTATLGTVLLNRDGSRLAYTDAEGHVRIRSPLAGSVDTVLTNAFQPLGFDPDDQRLHTLGADWSIQTWVAPDWRLSTTKPGPAVTPPISAIEASPDASRFALGRRGGVLEIWDTATAQRIGGGPAHTGNVFALAWNSNSTSLASGGSDRRILLWAPTNATPKAEFPVGTTEIVSLAWSHSGTRIAAGLDDGQTGIWNPTNGNRLATLQGHSASVQAVVFSPDDSRLITGGKDGDLVVWDSSTDRAWLRFPTDLLSAGAATSLNQGGRGVAQLRWTGSPPVLSAYLNNGTVHWWRLPPP